MSEQERDQQGHVEEERDLAPDEQAEEDVRGGVLPPNDRPGVTPPDT